MKLTWVAIALMLAAPRSSADAPKEAMKADPHSTSRFLSDRQDIGGTSLQFGAWAAASVTGPEVRRFEVTLSQGEFAAVGVKQLEGNLVVAAFDPDGALVGLEDRSGQGGVETVAWTVKASGQYAIQVAMFEWDAPRASFEIGLTARAPVGKTPDETAAQLFGAWHPDGYPGAALAVIERGKARLQRVAGLATLDPARNIDARTRFDLASVSKQFTGLAVAILAGRGLIDLDADIRTYLHQVPDFGSIVTVRHLLAHTSGLRDWDAGLGLAGRNIEQGISLPEVLAFVARQRELNFPPGSEQSYSNTNYSLLAAIVARQSGLPFEEFLRNEIFLPAGMSAIASAEPDVPVDRMARSYRGRLPEPEAVSRKPMVALGSSAIYASLDDMTAWVSALRKARHAPKTVAWSQFVQNGPKTGDPTYAYGLWRGARNGAQFLGHLGLGAGYRISFRWFPDRDLAVVYMTNDGGDVAFDRARAIEDLYLGFPQSPVEAPDAQYTPEPPTPLAAVAQFTGTYRSSELETAYEIAIVGARLVARHPVNGEIVLSHRRENEFSSGFVFMPSVRFRRSANGRIDAMIVSTDTARNMVFLKVPPEAEPLSR